MQNKIQIEVLVESLMLMKRECENGGNRDELQTFPRIVAALE